MSGDDSVRHDDLPGSGGMGPPSGKRSPTWCCPISMADLSTSTGLAPAARRCIVFYRSAGW